uniref:Ubiquitin-like protease family profile domain-containing protein n=1 Tax=Triticum urartu TaxID=4572 RepID=A0A8R7V8W4_TRIUA
MPPPDGDICTPSMLHAVLTFKWLHGAIINAYCKHLQHRDFSDHYISTTWFPKFMLSRARGETKSVNDLDSEHVTKKTKVIARVMDEYFRRDKAHFPMHVNDNHWITIVMHTVKEEFQVLDSNSKGAISQRIRNMIATLRAEISKDIMEANSTLESKKISDVSSWPINEYKMPRQNDGVSCGLFVMWCIKYWDGDRWTYEFDQEEINESRPRIVAEIIFSKVNKLEKVKMKIVKIMEKE